MKESIKQFQVLISATTLALSIISAAGMIFYRAGEMKAQDENILRAIAEKCK